jgi:hypothetical protein
MDSEMDSPDGRRSNSHLSTRKPNPHLPSSGPQCCSKSTSAIICVDPLLRALQIVEAQRTRSIPQAPSAAPNPYPPLLSPSTAATTFVNPLLLGHGAADTAPSSPYSSTRMPTRARAGREPRPRPSQLSWGLVSRPDPSACCAGVNVRLGIKG